uniref:Uncharacterized protein n=1 Tax=Siphoviridae sp. ctf8W5 TaxID=2825595 RepID=A0A8S5Q6J8_9CAUD|nr:MAG TPA: hypothetical protein [Siphoviridae sp. ctf8W5]
MKREKFIITIEVKARKGLINKSPRGRRENDE